MGNMCSDENLSIGYEALQKQIYWQQIPEGNPYKYIYSSQKLLPLEPKSSLGKILKWMDHQEICQCYEDQKKRIIKSPLQLLASSINPTAPYLIQNKQYVFIEKHGLNYLTPWMLLLEKYLVNYFATYANLHNAPLNLLFQIITGIAVPSLRVLSLTQIDNLYYRKNKNYITTVRHFEINKFSASFYQLVTTQKTYISICIWLLNSLHQYVQQTMNNDVDQESSLKESGLFIQIYKVPQQDGALGQKIAYTDRRVQCKTVFEEGFLQFEQGTFIVSTFNRFPSHKVATIVLRSSQIIKFEFQQQNVIEPVSVEQEQYQSKNYLQEGNQILSYFRWQKQNDKITGARGILFLLNKNAFVVSLRISIKNSYHHKIIFQEKNFAEKQVIYKQIKLQSKESTNIRFIRLKNQEVGAFYLLQKI